MSPQLQATPWWQRLAQNRLLDVAAVVLAMVSVGRIASRLPANAVRNDFAHYYLSSRLLLDGHNPYTTAFEPYYAAAGFVYHADVPAATNPPTFLWLFAPVAWLPARVGFWVWVAAQAGALLLILCLMRQVLERKLTARGWFFVWVAVISSATVYWHFQFSQVQLLLAAVLLGAYAWQRAGRGMRACLVVTLAGLIKLYPFVLLPWFVWGADGNRWERWKRAGAAALLAVAVVVATGPDLWRDFLKYGMKPIAQAAVNHTFNFTLTSFITNLGYAAYGFQPPGLALRAWWLAGVLAGLAFIGAAYIVVLVAHRDYEAQFCLLSVAMVAGSPTGWGHYLVFLIFPVIVMTGRLRPHLTVWTVLGVGLLLWLLNNLGTWSGDWLDRHVYVKILANYTPLYGMMIVASWFTANLIGRRPATLTEPEVR